MFYCCNLGENRSQRFPREIKDDDDDDDEIKRELVQSHNFSKVNLIILC